nr:DUF5993 family protein [Veronia nyctiphanis]
MMSLIFLLISIAMLLVMWGKEKPSYAVWALTLALSIYWLNHHATDTLSILL